MGSCGCRAYLVTLVVLAPVYAQDFHVYVGYLQSDSALVAWGTLRGSGNIIGRDARSYGEAELRIGNRTIKTTKAWAIAGGLEPDKPYPYEVAIKGKRIGGGVLRTYPREAEQLSFYVMGDWGNGTRAQFELAEVLVKDFQKRRDQGNPPRFVITTGDNIYGDTIFGVQVGRNSGDADNDWRAKFFVPYRDLISSIPFYPSLGNHDGNESESRGDLRVYLDNFFFPQNQPARYYSFPYGGHLAEFLALDSTFIADEDEPASFHAEEGRQSQWLRWRLTESKARWKIPYFHHPPYNAGPRHTPALRRLQHWVNWFRQSGVRVVFNGHEHNFQFTKAAETGGILFVTSGSGGELRSGDVRARMAAEHIAGWAPVLQFLHVEIDGGTMRITPISLDEPTIVDEKGKRLEMPIRVRQ